jgi:serine/threonine protein phosphatase PrpC
MNVTFQEASMKGRRHQMEDEHIVTRLDCGAPFVCVCDGHGGNIIAKQAIPKLLSILNKKIQIYEKINKSFHLNSIVQFQPLLIESVCELDKKLYNISRYGDVGSTLLFAILYNDVIYIANLGDSRAIVFTTQPNGTRGNLIASTRDHKPGDPVERQRIESLNAFVSAAPYQSSDRTLRVNGNLSLSRALGDFRYKTDMERNYVGVHHIISALPDIYTFPLSNFAKSDVYVVLACDGIWDVLTDKDVMYDVMIGITAKFVNDDAFNRLSGDNLTTVIMKITNQ